ncbi:MAG: T9SS type A sorting domain-containing protein, partial [Muribaculaceae bacterium]|nr:T9SS type A sorting domain-containing protein [Muribaculaceae bacterium]
VIGSTYGARPCSVDVDAADNVYVAFNDNGGGVGAWALPKAVNEFTTPANDHVKVAAGVFAETVVDHNIFYDGTTFTAGGELIEIYTASGVKVAQGYSVDASSLASGVYIARAGNKTLKVIK